MMKDGEETAAVEAAGTAGISAPCLNTLPSHPTARAFFAALGQRNQRREDDDTTTTTTNKKRCSAFIKKQLTSLGWRNRYSQEDQYPVTVVASSSSSSSSSLDTTAPITTRSFTVRQIQRGEIDGTYGTGACIWPAAICLIKYLEHQQQQCKTTLTNKIVVDLGSGTGVTSIAAALLGAKVVICTDGCQEVVQLASDNIQQAASKHHMIDLDNEDNTNATTATTCPVEEQDTSLTSCRSIIGGCKLYTQVLWWGRDSIIQTPCYTSSSDDSGNQQNNNAANDVDIVIVADCVLPKLYPIAPLVQAIDQLLVKDDAIAIISYEHRYYPDYDPRDKFQELALAKGLIVNVIPMEEHHPVYSVDDIEIWHVYGKNEPKPSTDDSAKEE